MVRSRLERFVCRNCRLSLISQRGLQLNVFSLARWCRHLRQAIRQPLPGWTRFESGLSDKILNDVATIQRATRCLNALLDFGSPAAARWLDVLVRAAVSPRQLPIPPKNFQALQTRKQRIVRRIMLSADTAW